MISLVKWGELCGVAYTLREDGTYVCCTILPETGKVLVSETGKLRQSVAAAAESLRTAGYSDTRLILPN